MGGLEFCILVGLLLWGFLAIINKHFKQGGGQSTSSAGSNPARNPGFAPITDKYTTYEEVQQALQKAGLESSNLIIGVDFTKSNEHTGTKTFHGKCLHYIDPNPAVLNPYQQVISILGRTLEAFDDDKEIPAFGFGDLSTSDKKVFSFIPTRSCFRFTEVLEKYNEITPVVVLSGPTSFAPLIEQAISIVRDKKSYHILVIIADGQVTNERDTQNAIVKASNYALSIILVGVGDGPWDMMREFDDGLPSRKFDNFQFVNFNDFFGPRAEYHNPDIAFAVAALQEVPDQYKEIRRLHLL